jgi:hypothetical protein
LIFISPKPGSSPMRRPKRGLERAGIGRSDPAGVERPDALLQLQGAREGGRNGYLLVEREADQERHRLLGEQSVGLVVPGEVQPVGHEPDPR